MAGDEAAPSRDWQTYYRATQGRPPRPTLLRALDAFAREGLVRGGLAIDLGCGSGRDALPLLRAGWRVWALDGEPVALQQLEAQARAEGLEGGLTAVLGRFETTELPPCDLVNASFALFACRPPDFPGLWQGIVAAIRPGGRFAGQILGPRDSWAARPETSSVTRDALDVLLAPFELERLEEEETDSVTPMGEAKHWHIWHVNARKPLS
jgi:SAM-dependent methyltransferase